MACSMQVITGGEPVTTPCVLATAQVVSPVSGTVLTQASVAIRNSASGVASSLVALILNAGLPRSVGILTKNTPSVPAPLYRSILFKPMTTLPSTNPVTVLDALQASQSPQ